jgi:hypothetical protein
MDSLWPSLFVTCGIPAVWGSPGIVVMSGLTLETGCLG